MAQIPKYLVSMKFSNNETYVGYLRLGDAKPGTSNGNGTTDNVTSVAAEEDPKGATTYVIAVILIYGMSIMFLIASHVFIKKRSVKESETQISRYLEQAPDLREKSSRDNFRKLKKSLIPLIARSPAARELISHKDKYASYLLQYQPVDDTGDRKPSPGGPRKPSRISPKRSILKKPQERTWASFGVGDIAHASAAILVPNRSSLPQIRLPAAESKNNPVGPPRSPTPPKGVEVLYDYPWIMPPIEIHNQKTSTIAHTQQDPDIISQSSSDNNDPRYGRLHSDVTSDGGIVSLSDAGRALSSVSISSASSDSVFEDSVSVIDDTAGTTGRSKGRSFLV